MSFVKDEEIDLTKDNDLLNGKSYALALKNAILAEAPNNEAFVVGLFGEWGSGKSTIIKTSQSLIEQDKKQKKKIKFITYDAWKYVNDSFRRMFLLQIQQSLGLDRTNLMDRFYSNKSEELEVNTYINKRKLRWSITYISLILFVISFFPICGFITPEYIKNLFGSMAGITFIFNLFKSWLDNLKVSSQTPLMFAAEQFEECFNEMINYALTRKGLVEKSLKWIIGDKRETNIDKLVIVIDNIDRCDSKTTYELLSNIKSFLLKNKKLVFIIPTDDKALCKHLIASFACSHMAAEEFLRKIFNIEIRIKPLEEIELFDFADKINSMYELNFSADAISIIANEFATNPRRIIQFFNNMKTELEIIKNNIAIEKVQDVQNIVCKLLIIREEWPDYYKLILTDSRLLNADYYENKENLYNQDSKDLKNLNRFLKKTSVFRFTGGDQLLEKVISNNTVFNDIPADVRLGIQNLEKDKLVAFVERKEKNFDFLINYVIEKLKKSILRGTWKSDVPNLFKAILLINSIEKISTATNAKIEREIKGIIAKFIGNLGNANSEYMHLLGVYLNDLNVQNNKYFIQELLDSYFKEKFTNEDEIDSYDISLFGAPIKNIKDKNVFEKYKDLFYKWYEVSSENITIIQPEDLKYFISDELIQEIVSKIEVHNDVYLNEFLYVAKNYKLPSGCFNNFFNKINQLYPEYSNKNAENILQGIKKVIPVLETMCCDDKIEALQIYINKIFKDVQMSYNSRASLINDNLHSDENKTIVINFLTLVYRATNNNINIISYLDKIIQKYPNLKNQILLSLQKSISNFGKVEIVPLKKFIFGQKIYTESYVYWVTRFISLVWAEDDSYVLTESELEQEIKNIINEIETTDDKSEIDMLNNLINVMLEKRKNEIISAIIKALENVDKDIIIKLNKNIHTVILSKICENISEYSDNREILEIIARYGNESNINKLMTFILSEIPYENKKDDMVSLYKLISPNKIKKSDKNKIEPYLIEIDEEIKE